MKTNKSITKRFKITKNGKIKARGKGHGHFNAKESGREGQSKKRMKDMVIPMSNKTKSRFFQVKTKA